ncbi:amidophosphoribosyltransferase [Candidatus Micrarchaeota archaeon]|nr:amidophosphoribosyltransferase [Candidatus Micrarchaeota archaeon]
MINHSLAEKRESCGIVGIFCKKGNNAANFIYHSMIALQHRGQDAAGIAVYNKDKLRWKGGLGLVTEVFKTGFKINGGVGIGHTRYPTAGRLVLSDVQPVVYKNVAVAHNGHIANYEQMKEELEKRKIKLKSTVDSEIIAILLAEKAGDGIEAAVKEVMARLDGSFSVVALIDNYLVAFRDRNAIRPLVYGENDELLIFASESAGLDINNVEYSGEVVGGELVILGTDGKMIRKQVMPNTPRHCMFEYVYFSRPDSIINQRNVFEVRKRLGVELARECPVKADIVIPIPDTARTAAETFAKETKIGLEEGLIKNRYIGRTFIMPTQIKRSDAVRMKLNPIRSVINGKRIVLIDDSVVRGTTLREIVRLVKGAGAREVHLRITCPPIKAPCFYGVDMSTYKELIAHERTVEEIRKFLEVDSLGYLSIEGLKRAISLPLCTGCLNEDYPTETARAIAREKREDRNGCG